MRYSSRLFLYAPLVAVAALAVAASLLWQSVSGRLETDLQRANGHEVAPGVTLRFSHQRIGGFPFNVDAILDDVTFEVRSGFGPIRWHTEHFALHELTFGRAQQIYEAAGIQTFDWIDSTHSKHHFVFVPGSLQASAISSRAGLLRFDLDINGIGSHEVTGARLQLHFRKSPGQNAIDLVLSADGFHMARGLEDGFGPGMEQLLMRGRLVPAVPLAKLFAGEETWIAAFDRWRRNDGAFRLDRFDIQWGAVRAQGTGSLSLDAAHRWQGKLEFAMAGGGPDLRRAEPGGARLARALAQVAEDGPARPLHVSASIASGAVNLAITGAGQTAVPAGTIGAMY